MNALTPAVLHELSRVGAREGLLRLSAVRLDHPGFARAHAALAGILASRERPAL